MEDITASSTAGWYSVISLHGGGSPQAMKREIFRQYPIEERRALVERLLDRGVAHSGSSGAPRGKSSRVSVVPRAASHRQQRKAMSRA